jgi:hypothetical protein
MESGGANREPAASRIAQLRLTPGTPCYVPLALTLRRGHALLVGLCGLLAAGAIGCGGERQDENEAEASYDVEIVKAKFPERQRLAQESELAITVRNDDTETIPDIAVTLAGLDRRLENPSISDPTRPVFVIDGDPVEIGGYPDVKLAAPEGGQTALVGTWTLGKLKPNAEKTFRWRMTAVRPGPFEITYAVAAGLDGKATAVGPDDEQPRGAFKGSVTSAAPQSRIAADGRTVVNPAP